MRLPKAESSLTQHRLSLGGKAVDYSEAGHMMYVHPPSLAKMKGDIAAFIDSTARRPR